MGATTPSAAAIAGPRTRLHDRRGRSFEPGQVGDLKLSPYALPEDLDGARGRFVWPFLKMSELKSNPYE